MSPKWIITKRRPVIMQSRWFRSSIVVMTTRGARERDRHTANVTIQSLFAIPSPVQIPTTNMAELVSDWETEFSIIIIKLEHNLNISKWRPWHGKGFLIFFNSKTWKNYPQLKCELWFAGTVRFNETVASSGNDNTALSAINTTPLQTVIAGSCTTNGVAARIAGAVYNTLRLRLPIFLNPCGGGVIYASQWAWTSKSTRYTRSHPFKSPATAPIKFIGRRIKFNPGFTKTTLNFGLVWKEWSF